MKKLYENEINGLDFNDFDIGHVIYCANMKVKDFETGEWFYTGMIPHCYVVVSKGIIVEERKFKDTLTLFSISSFTNNHKSKARFDRNGNVNPNQDYWGNILVDPEKENAVEKLCDVICNTQLLVVDDEELVSAWENGSKKDMNKSQTIYIEETNRNFDINSVNLFLDVFNECKDKSIEDVKNLIFGDTSTNESIDLKYKHKEMQDFKLTKDYNYMIKFLFYYKNIKWYCEYDFISQELQLENDWDHYIRFCNLQNNPSLEDNFSNYSDEECDRMLDKIISYLELF